MNLKKIYLSHPKFSGIELSYLQKIFDNNQSYYELNFVQEFENKFAKYLQINECVALNSGTSAIHLALKALGVKKGDSVICSTFTFAASAFPIKYIGANPIFIDSELETWNMCPILLEEAILKEIEKGKKPKVIILVHTYGVSAKIEEVLKIAKKYTILVLEDAAEALGASYRDKYCGLFGDIGVFSFNSNKIITTLGGGVLVSNNTNYIEKVRYWANQSKENFSYYQHLEIGHNYKMSILSAAVGLGQLDSINREIKRRQEIYKFYKEEFKNIEEITFLENKKNSISNFWLTCILFKEKNDIAAIMRKMIAEKIESRFLWKPMHQQPIFENEMNYLNGVSDELFKKGLTLPTSSKLSYDDLNRIVKIIKEQFKND